MSFGTAGVFNWAGSTTMTIQNGGQVICPPDWGPGNANTVSISGSGSQLIANAPVFVSNYPLPVFGGSTINVTGGGQITTTGSGTVNLYIGALDYGALVKTGSVLVDGSGSGLSVYSILVGGNNNSGSLTLQKMRQWLRFRLA